MYTGNMNERQINILSKQFKVTDEFSLTRGEFEGFPCPMVACLWTDEQMQQLADEVKLWFHYDKYPDTYYEMEELEDEWYSVIETCALKLGMVYYEDLTNEEVQEINEKWNSVK